MVMINASEVVLLFKSTHNSEPRYHVLPPIKGSSTGHLLALHGNPESQMRKKQEIVSILPNAGTFSSGFLMNAQSLCSDRWQSSLFLENVISRTEHSGC